ncbi:amino acid ABC transporter permease [Oenococcus sicerae]|uniref:Amino acid ABC transporter permease n=1 Tax=Oenococcus sicerae TaxID=2203724 RepID=A0AAJ1VMI1_9LACO|nr:amino acid ABC transporter permease [Oenococcus sicerae]MDN6899676.1 amino acid ABC transporter permease [Oenococcus sicerae]
MFLAMAALNFSKMWPFRKIFINGLFNTLELTILALAFGIFLGLILALVKIAKLPLLGCLARFYTSIFRGTPLLVQIFLIYFGAKEVIGFNIDAFPSALLSLSLNAGAYISEILRGGIQAVDGGQNEAARSLGLGYWRSMINIVIPQGLKAVLPSMVNESISLLKDTSLVSTVGMLDLMRAGMIAQGETYLAFEPFLVIAIIYYILVMILSYFSRKLERNLVQ